MKTFLRLMVASLSLCVSSAVVAACGDEDDSTPNVSNNGVDSGADSSSASNDSGAGADSSSSNTDAATEADTSTATNGLAVTVTYTGTAQGALSLAVFPGSAAPPVGPPAGSQRFPTPTFPITHTFNLPPGDYVLSGYLDIGNDSMQGPGPGDLVSVPPFTLFTITSGTVSKSIAIADADGG